MDKKKVLKEFRSWFIVIIASLFVALLFNSEVFASVIVDQSSMENTLFADQRLIIDKFSYHFTEPKRGEIITFYENDTKGNIINEFKRSIENMVSIFDRDREESDRLIKRVIAVEGDEVDIIEGFVYVNGEMLEEPYIHNITEPGKIIFPITVGENQLFVLGDNREVSIDSREFGLIQCNQVEGKAVFRVYPFKKMGKIK